MKLKNGQINFQGKVNGEALLEKCAEAWHGKSFFDTLLPNEGEGDLSDIDLLIYELYRYCPLVITGNQNLVLEAEMRQYPYSINDEKNYRCFSISLKVVSGSIKSVALDEKGVVAINLFSIQMGDNLIADFGNGHLHFELLFSSTTASLLPPPKDFKEKRFTIQDV